MKRRSPRDAVATALASQIDCKTFIGSASDGVVATSASTAAFSATGASTALFGDACCAPLSADSGYPHMSQHATASGTQRVHRGHHHAPHATQALASAAFSSVQWAQALTAASAGAGTEDTSLTVVASP